MRVRYCECDPMGVAHHSACVAWFEMGRTELLRGTGITYRAMEEAGMLLVVTKLEIRYKLPGRYDDELVVAEETDDDAGTEDEAEAEEAEATDSDEEEVVETSA